MTARRPSPAGLSAEAYRALVADQMSEAVLQQRVTALASTLGWLRYHTHDSRRSQPGFPDLVLVHEKQGRVLFRELKRNRGRLRQDQRIWLDTLTAAGADAGVWRPTDLLSESIRHELTRSEP